MEGAISYSITRRNYFNNIHCVHVRVAPFTSVFSWVFLGERHLMKVTLVLSIDNFVISKTLAQRAAALWIVGIILTKQHDFSNKQISDFRYNDSI